MVDICFTAHHCNQSQALKDYANKRFAVVKKHFSPIIKMHLTFDVESKLRQKASARIIIPNTKELHAVSVSTDMYKSIDLLVDKVKALVDKHKSKVRSH